ncbi:MAG TPA: hypothetical protein VFT41_00205 [Gemmatimonadaceae bacterium]|nr:hypothetical protein [Gemmatimonadaceae bacterium]
MLTSASVLALSLTQPAPARAQVSVGVAIGAQLGPSLSIFAYSPARYGEWREHYRAWTPVEVYEVDGRYYHRRMRGARVVVVYEYHDQYFFPPRDDGWRGYDRRYDYDHRPLVVDYERARPYHERHEDDDDHGHGRGRGRGRGHGDGGG